MSQYGDIEQKQYDDFELLRAFHKYLSVPTYKTYDILRSNVKSYNDRSTIDCLNLLDRYRSDWVFKVLLWRALAGSETFIDPTKITPVNHSK